MAELQELGHQFRTRSDTEVIVHAWEAWGEKCVERFRGMFAFAIWDTNKETLFLARDRLGVKPLYYAVLADGMVVFGSELKSVLMHPGVTRNIDPCAVEQYFALGYVAEPRRSSRRGKLPPGHCVKRGGRSSRFATGKCRFAGDAMSGTPERGRKSSPRGSRSRCASVSSRTCRSARSSPEVSTRVQSSR